MKIYVVCGGCPGDHHVIAVYKTAVLAEERATQENRKCRGLNAYFEAFELLGEERGQW